MTEPKPKQVRIYQPTYQLNPRKRFNVEKVEKIIKQIVDKTCVMEVGEDEEIEYSEKIVPDLCIGLAESIRNAVKEEKYDRYRLIVTVTVTQRRNQGFQIFHSFLWDHERDAFASYNYENCHLYLTATVYGVYLD